MDVGTVGPDFLTSADGAPDLGADIVSSVLAAPSAARSEALVASLLQRAPIGFALVDEQCRYEMINETLAEINGVAVEDHIGRTIASVLPEIADAVTPVVRGVFETGEPVIGVQVAGSPRNQPGVEVTVSASYYRLELDGDVRVGLFVEDVTKQAAARRRAEILASVSEMMSRVDSLNDISHIVATEVASYFDAPTAIVGLWDPGTTHARILTSEPVRRSLASQKLSIEDDAPYALAARTREIVTVGDPDDRSRRFTSDIGAELVAEAVVPCLASSGDLVGVMTIGWDRPMAPGEFPIPQLKTVARLIAGVVERTRLSRHRRELIEELQDTLLAPPPVRERIETAVRYLPAENATGLGGDWFDVIAVDDNRTAMVVGDVVGHGPVAAARMSQIGSTIAQLLVMGTPLDALFSEAERVLEARSIRTMATVAVVMVDTTARTLTSVSAGHLPALVIPPDRSPELLRPALRPPLLTCDHTLTPLSVGYDPGTQLVMFTDGLIETRGGDIDSDLDRLLAHAAEIGGTDSEVRVERLADHLLELAFGGRQFDDLALLAVHLL